MDTSPSSRGQGGSSCRCSPRRERHPEPPGPHPSVFHDSEAIPIKTIVHVNKHLIRAGADQPLTVKTYKSNNNAAEADIVVNGEVVASIVYRPDKPLSCGAKVWIETEHEVQIR